MRPCRAVVNQGCIRTRLSRFRDFKTLCTSCSEVKPGLKLVNHITTRAGYLHTRLLFHKPSDGFGMGFGFGCTPDFCFTNLQMALAWVLVERQTSARQPRLGKDQQLVQILPESHFPDYQRRTTIGTPTCPKIKECCPYFRRCYQK